MKNFGHWLHGLGAAAITGGASALTAGMIDPETFNLQTGWKNVGMLAAVNAVLGAAAYLKQSPLPPVKNGASTS